MRKKRTNSRKSVSTCSLLAEEDETQIEHFLGGHGDFSLVPIGDIWRDVIGGEPPARGDTLRLTPARHGTDGFFVAVMARQAAPKKLAPRSETRPRIPL